MLKKMASLRLALSILLLIIAGCAIGTPARRSLAFTQNVTANEIFIPHVSTQRMGSYLALDVNFVAISQLRSELENKIGKTLKHRDEAHITVITPPEFDEVLSQRISMQQINSLAEKHKIQLMKFKLICVGRGELGKGSAKLETYYLVVSSDDLFKLRAEIHQLFTQKGGDPKAFNPDQFFPHITMGFNQRDLHFEEGVVKDERSCVYSLSETGLR